MAKTYTSNLPTATTGTVLTASNYNNLITDVNNLVVPPMSIWASVAQTVSTGNTLNYSTSVVNTDAMTNSSGVVTIQTTGVYQILASIIFTWASGTLTLPALNIFANGNEVGTNYIIPNNSNLQAGMQVAATVSMTAGQTIYSTMTWTTVANLTVTAQSLNYLAINWIGRTA